MLFHASIPAADPAHAALDRAALEHRLERAQVSEQLAREGAQALGVLAFGSRVLPPHDRFLPAAMRSGRV